MTSTKHEKYDKSKSFRRACATLYNNINDCLSCIQVWCIEGNPTTRRIKVDSSYLLPSITTPALAFWVVTETIANKVDIMSLQ